MIADDIDRYVVPFAELFGIRPWEIPQLQRSHYLSLRARVDQREREAARGD